MKISESTKISRDKSYDDALIATLKDPAEAAAYIQAALESKDDAALLRALREVSKANQSDR